MKRLLWLLAGFFQLAAAQETPPANPPKLPFNPANPGVHDPVMAKEGDNYYVFGTGDGIDPNIIVDEKGTPWFVFGSFWDGFKAVPMTQDMMKLKWPEQWHTIARRPTAQKPYNYGLEDSQIEGAFVYRHGDYYYLFASFDMCCRGVNSNYHVVVGRSETVTGPYLDKAGFSMMDGNGTDIAIGDGNVLPRWDTIPCI